MKWDWDKKPTWLRWLVNIILLFILFVVLGWWQNRHLISSGKLAPEFSLHDYYGNQIKLKDLRGKRVILYFWATWCPVCKTNMGLLKVTTPYYKKNPVFLSILIDSQNKMALQRIMENKKLNFPVLLANETIAKQYHIRSYPTTYFINKEGKIKSVDSGFLTPIGIWWRSLWAML